MKAILWGGFFVVWRNQHLSCEAKDTRLAGPQYFAERMPNALEAGLPGLKDQTISLYTVVFSILSQHHQRDQTNETYACRCCLDRTDLDRLWQTKSSTSRTGKGKFLENNRAIGPHFRRSFYTCGSRSSRNTTRWRLV
jgi:hypothetical protein